MRNLYVTWILQHCYFNKYSAQIHDQLTVFGYVVGCKVWVLTNDEPLELLLEKSSITYMEYVNAIQSTWVN